MNKFTGFVFIIVASIFSACELVQSVGCTEEFVSVAVTVAGVELDQTYTVEMSTGDTVAQATGPFLDSIYVVLDDGYQPDLEGRTDSFRLIGLANGRVELVEDFVIGADECHIFKVSGPEQVNLPVACTLQFETVSVEVSGPALDQTYTIRIATGDTVYRATSAAGSNFYTVLTDNYVPELAGQEADFQFLGFAGGTKTVDETYRIGADLCHIYKVSGKAAIP